MGGVTGSKAGMRRGGRPRNFDEGMRGGNEQAGSAGTDQASAGGEVMKNLFIYGACLGGMIIMLFSAMRVRRRRI